MAFVSGKTFQQATCQGLEGQSYTSASLQEQILTLLRACMLTVACWGGRIKSEACFHGNTLSATEDVRNVWVSPFLVEAKEMHKKKETISE